MLVLGVVGLAGNVAATWVLASGERSDINLEGVLRHSAADALSSLGVIVAGAVVLTTGWDRVDALSASLIAVLIAAGSWRLLKEPHRGADGGGAGRHRRQRGRPGDVRECRTWSRSTTCTCGR